MEIGNNNIEQTLAIIKPDGIKNATKIIEMIYQNGLTIEKYEIRQLDVETVREHYSHLLDAPFYGKLEEFMTSDFVILMVLSGVNAIQKYRTLMGPTDSAKAPKGTIRGEFGTDKTYNAVHGSDSIISAEAEIKRFFGAHHKKKVFTPIEV